MQNKTRLPASDRRGTRRRADDVRRTGGDGTPELFRRAILSRKGVIGCGKDYTASLSPDGGVIFRGADRQGQAQAAAWSSVVYLACGPDYLLGLSADGCVQFAGADLPGGLLASGAADLVSARALSCGPRHAAALLGGGQVVCIGDTSGGRCATESWRGIVDVVCGKDFTVGLTQAGDVVCAGSYTRSRRLSSWHRVAGIFTDVQGRRVFGITAEGRLLCDRPLPRAVRAWEGLCAVAADGSGIRAVTTDGQLLSTRANDGYMQRDAAALAAGSGYAVTVSLTGDVHFLGPCVDGACRTEDYGQTNEDGRPPVFTHFDLFTEQRDAAREAMLNAERQYQLRRTSAGRYARRLACGERMTACISADGRVLTTADFPEARTWRSVVDVQCGAAHLLALHDDGRVSACGNDTDGCCGVSEWRGVSRIYARRYHSLALCADGRVLFAGRGDTGLCGAADWQNIRLLCAGDSAALGVDTGGRILLSGTWQGGAVPMPEGLLTEKNGWGHAAGLTDVRMNDDLIAGLYQDGHVSLLASPRLAAYADEWGSVADWHDVREICLGEGFLLGLCVGGRVLFAGKDVHGLRGVTAWRHVVALACGRTHAVGLCADGHVLSVGVQRNGEERRGGSIDLGGAVMAWEKEAFTGYTPIDTSGWTDVIALAGGPEHTIALSAQGHVLSTGLDLDRQCTAARGFVLFRDIRQYDGFGRYGELYAEELQKKRDELTASGIPGASREEDGENPSALLDGTECLPSEWPQISAALRAHAEKTAARVGLTKEHIFTADADGVLRSYTYGGILTATQPLGVTELFTTPLGVLALTHDGHVLRLIHPTDGKTPPEDLTLSTGLTAPVRQIRSGSRITAFLCGDGCVRTLTADAPPEKDQLPQAALLPWSGVSSVTVGDAHVAALEDDGGLLTTQSGGGGGSFLSFNLRSGYDFRIGGRKPRFASLAAGGGMTAALCPDGSVQSWGENGLGQCQTAAWSDVLSLSASGTHTAALHTDGRVSAVGDTSSGACDTSLWRQIISVTALPGRTVGLTASGSILCAGKPIKALRALNRFVMVSVSAHRVEGQDVLLCVDGDGGLHPVTAETPSQEAGSVTVTLPPEKESKGILDRILPDLSFTQAVRLLHGSISCGFAHDVRVMTDGSGTTAQGHPLGRVRAAGEDDLGQTRISTWPPVLCASAGLNHTAAVTAAGDVLAVGRNRDGQCAVERLNARLVRNPAPGSRPPEGADRFVSVACGYGHTAALRGDGRVFAVGENIGPGGIVSHHGDGCCDVKDWTDVTFVTCGIRQTAAITRDGRCLFCGDGDAGQGGVTSWRGMITLSCGEFHTVGLTEDGKVCACGANDYGQCDVSDLTDVISLTALPEATVCVLADGRAVCRGRLPERKAKLLPLISSAVAVAGCESRLLFLTADRRVIRI